MTRLHTIMGVVALTAVSSLATASFTVEDVPAWRGDANTLYGGWSVFTEASNSPNFANEGNMGFASQIYNFGQPGAFITSTNNIYNPSGELSIHNYTDLGSGVDITDAVVNMASLGAAPDFAGVIAQAVLDDGSTVTLDAAEAESVNYFEQGFFATYNVSWTFDLSNIAGNVEGLAFIIGASGTSMSLDDWALDLRFDAIPAPGALALLGLAGLAGRRRRR